MTDSDQHTPGRGYDSGWVQLSNTHGMARMNTAIQGIQQDPEADRIVVTLHIDGARMRAQAENWSRAPSAPVAPPHMELKIATSIPPARGLRSWWNTLVERLR